MYVIEMSISAQYQEREYAFNSKAETRKFLEGLSNGQIETILSIHKYNKSSFRTAWNDFFEN